MHIKIKLFQIWVDLETGLRALLIAMEILKTNEGCLLNQ